MFRHFKEQTFNAVTDDDLNPDNYETRFNSIVNSGFVCLGLGLGQKLGLPEVLLDATDPLSSDEVAEKLGYNERYVREWLNSMTAAKIVFVTDELKFYIPPDCKEKTKSSLAYSAMLPAVAPLTKDVEQCFRSKDTNSAGYDFSKCEDAFEFMNEDRKQCDAKWIEEIAFPASFIKKGRIKRILDIGCGVGTITLNVGKYFPEAEVIGVDIDEFAIKKANKNKEEQNVKNVTFYQMNGGELLQDWTGQFDWITMLIVLHDLPDPDSCVKEILRVVCSDGVVTFLDPLCHSDPRRNVGNEVFAASLTMSCFLCLPCSHSAPPFAGNGLGWGYENRAKYLNKFGLKILTNENQKVIHCMKQDE